MNKEEIRKEKKLCYSVLAKNMYAMCPEGVNKRRFAAIRKCMKLRVNRAWMAEPPGLNTYSELWVQLFRNLAL